MTRATAASGLFITSLYATITALQGSYLWAAACAFVAGGIARQLYGLMEKRGRQR